MAQGSRIGCLGLLVASFCLPASAELGRDWVQATASAAWSGRGEHSSVVYDEKLWVMGGWCCLKTDVWYSSNGVNWSQATASANWSGRCGHSSVVFDNKMWVIGGFDDVDRNDVWYSSNGVNWTQATAAAPWPARGWHTSVVFDNKMWVIGGSTWWGTGPGIGMNDVWYSSDGVNWAQATAAAPWPGRLCHTSVVYDGKIWVLGGAGVFQTGSEKHDVWYSSDGANWTLATAAAYWSARSGHSSVVCDGKIWVIGGGTNDVWYSSDGVNWDRATAAAPWSSRRWHTSVVHDGKTWVIGGGNDVWYSVGSQLPAPTGLSASDGTDVDKVRVTWNASPGATDYCVYRAPSPFGTKTAVSGWQSATSFDDTSTEFFKSYCYWVKARDAQGESDYSAHDRGWRAMPLTSARPSWRLYR